MQTIKQILFLACTLSLAWSARDLSGYPFKVTLNTEEKGGLYELYWNFDNEAETISFAVRVQTTGWVGFGLSPNGQMPDSDVVIGWVSGGETIFHDRFAAGRGPPSIDEQQDWKLVFGEEDNGFTILEFSRNFVTCDDQDMPITVDTARAIWSFHDTTDPTSEVLDFSNRHTHKGAQSLNLLGGLPSAAPDPDDLEYYDVTVDEVTIPDADTTYWCAAFRLPEHIRNQTRYVTKMSPHITEGNDAHVHHLLVYQCDGLNHTHVGNGGPCDDGVANEVAECRGGTLIAGWAVGGETFVFPDNVAFPFGGEGFPEYLVMELHYDNPTMIEGVVDSSGMRLWYTSTPREHDAGTLSVGHFVSFQHIIPPNSKNFTTTGVVTSECTNAFLPEEGIHVFANGLHTHEVGHGLNLQHLRYNSDCGVYEELEPIEKNLRYDFNYQQTNHLHRELIIKPGDILQLKCFYGTEGADGVTLGGLSTRDEMCLAFMMYYPKLNFSAGLSQIEENEFAAYLSTLPGGDKILSEEVDYKEGLDAVDWDDNKRAKLQKVVDESTQSFLCIAKDDVVYGTTKFPEIGCPYVAPDQCSSSTPLTCCERIAAATEETPSTETPSTESPTATEDGVVMRASGALLLTLSLLAAIMG